MKHNAGKQRQSHETKDCSVENPNGMDRERKKERKRKKKESQSPKQRDCDRVRQRLMVVVVEGQVGIWPVAGAWVSESIPGKLEGVIGHGLSSVTNLSSLSSTVEIRYPCLQSGKKKHPQLRHLLLPLCLARRPLERTVDNEKRELAE